MGSMACWLTNPHRSAEVGVVRGEPCRSGTDVPRSAVPQPVRLAEVSDGAVKHRLVSGMTRVDITRRTARLASYERGRQPKRLPGPYPDHVICGNLMVGLVGDTVGDVRILERQHPEWLVTNHRPRPRLEPPHLCSDPSPRLVEEVWPGAHLLEGAQESHASARRSLRYVPVGFESEEPSVEPSAACSHRAAAALQLHDQHGGPLGVWQRPEALGSSPPAWSQHEDAESAFQQRWQQHWQQHLHRAARLRG